MNDVLNFSVLMSVYKNDNSEHFLLALESVSTKQTIKPKEIIIIKDGPVNDKIDSYISFIKDTNKDIIIKVVGTEKNNGLASALNYGLSFVETEWIARMDSDDISLPNRFELQTNYLLQHEEVSVLGGFTEEFNEKPGDLKRIRTVPINNADIYRQIKKRNPLNHPTVFIRKKCIDKVNGYSSDYGKVEDYKLWIDFCIENYKIFNLTDTLVYMRVGNGFIERRNDKKEIDNWDKIQKYMLEKHIICRLRSIINSVKIRIFIYMPKWMKRLVYKYFLRR